MKKLLLLFTFAILVADAAIAQEKPDDRRWKEFTSQEGRFKVEFPGDPKTVTADEDTPTGKVRGTRSSISIDGVGLMVMWSDSSGKQEKTDKALKEHYDKLRDVIIAKPDRRLIFDRDVTVDGKLGREFAISTATQIVAFKIFVVGDRLYQLIGTQNIKPSADDAGLKNIVRFFNSIRLVGN